ncbi:MAG TPA: ADOP family duplicated permease, partial [Gemmatimonadaceae bacterium]|nr:ADOP family duplicated permease [Gemmatimonadaceae bacterium]
RDSWGIGWWERTLQDIRFAWRGFRHAPTFVVSVIATIALALGLNTTAFTIFNAYVLRPIAARDPYSLYEMRVVDRRGHAHHATWANLQELRALRAPAQVFGLRHAFARIDGLPVFGELATGDALQGLGAGVALGRSLLPADAALPAGESVMVLSYDTWRSRFGADSSIVGRRLLVRGQPLMVVGVLDKHFQGLGGVPPDFWAPITLVKQFDGTDLSAPHQAEALRIIFRLRPDESPDEARAMLATWARRATAQSPDTLQATGVELMSVANAMPSDSSETYIMFAPVLVAFGLVLLIACANVANVMLARGLARQREIGIRLSLGAERRRLIVQLLTESVLLALPAAVLGFFLSRWTIDAGVRAMFASMPPDFAPYIRVVPLVPDMRVFAFILVAAVVAAILFGLAPALQATRPNIVQASRGNFDTTYRPGRLRTVLLLSQVTVCSLLLITTAVLLRGATAAGRAETGLATDNRILLSLDARTKAAARQKLETHPVVEAVAGGVYSPVDAMFPSLSATTGGRAADSHVAVQLAYNIVTANYFDVLGIPIVHGRTFTPGEEDASAQSVVISEATAQSLWPGRDAIGRELEIATPFPEGHRLHDVRTVTVVGVARNAVSGWIGTGLDRNVAYFPEAIGAPDMRMVAKVRGNEHDAKSRLDRDIETALANSPIEELHTVNEYLAVQRYPFRAFSWIAMIVGGIALLLTCGGIYGVLSYLVTQRTREIGIRMALGASMRGVVRLVLRESLTYALIGAAIGSTLALGVARVLASQLVLVPSFDLVAFAGGLLIVVGAALAASFPPARRAAGVDPMVALREE